MKKLILFSLLSLFFALPLFAANNTSSMKLGVVNLQKALNEVEEGKAAKATLQSNFEKEQKKLDILKKEMETEQAEYQKKRLVVSGEELKTAEETLRKKMLSMQEALKNSQQNLAQQELQATGKILEALKQLVKEIGQKEGYTFIFENSQEVLLYSLGAEDITERVITTYNARRKK